MQSSPGSECLGNACDGKRILFRLEGDHISRLADLTGKVFNVPVAYAAMLGRRDRVMSRVGSGSAYWKNLKTLPLARYLAAPIIQKDATRGSRDGVETGELPGHLKFVASAPIDTPCGVHLGILVIASPEARPGFSAQDLDTLVELAGLMADEIEMRMIASHAMSARLRHEEAEQRFQTLANSAPALIACTRADGTCEFVNEAWLRYTGRIMNDEVGEGWHEVIHERHQTPALHQYGEALRTGNSFSVSVPLRRHDGVYRWMRGGGTPRFLEDNSFAGFMICLHEVSDYIEVLAATETLRGQLYS